MLQSKKTLSLSGILIFAVIVKLILFLFAAIYAPQGKFLPDSQGYLNLADMIIHKGVFALQDASGNLIYENFRTPGYPLFIAIFHGLIRLPLDGIILIQIIMTLAAAFIVYKTAMIIDPKIAFLSALIILLDPPITIFSMTILTESLFLLFIAIFAYLFTSYIKSRRVGQLILSAVILAISAYIRPVAYYLGFALALFVICAGMRGNFWRGLKHALIFLLVAYSVIGLWQLRNYIRCHSMAFCTADQFNLSSVGLFKSYARNTDPHTQGMAPLPYYVNVTFRSAMSLLTRPGNFKYFQCKPLTLGSLAFSYPWMIFWVSGFVWGIINMRRNIYVQAMLFIALYFIAASVGGLMWSVCERIRVPIMPFIAIISAYGWTLFLGRIRKS